MEYLKSDQLKRRTRQKIPMRRNNKIELNFPQHVKIAIKLRDGRCVNCKSPRKLLTAHHFVLKSAFGMVWLYVTLVILTYIYTIKIL